MCYANIPCAAKRGSGVRRRWLLLQASTMAAELHAPRTGVARDTASSGAGSMKQCLCSPTKHPGSFRCRHHHAEYVWGGQFAGTSWGHGKLGTGKMILESTIGAAFFTQVLSLNEVAIKFDIWDTAGQEKYHSLAPMYYRGAAAAIVLYNVTSSVTCLIDTSRSLYYVLSVDADQLLKMLPGKEASISILVLLGYEFMTRTGLKKVEQGSSVAPRDMKG
ncbi:hypothetical protein V6N13_051484 [Hibiscus sabdariffa]